jgi:hypothetical protein
MVDSTLLDDLRAHLAQGDVLVVIGAGVSIGATNRSPVASWAGLLKHGLGRCRAVCSLTGEWLEKKNGELASRDFLSLQD